MEDFPQKVVDEMECTLCRTVIEDWHDPSDDHEVCPKCMFVDYGSCDILPYRLPDYDNKDISYIHEYYNSKLYQLNTCILCVNQYESDVDHTIMMYDRMLSELKYIHLKGHFIPFDRYLMHIIFEYLTGKTIRNLIKI